MDSPKLRLRYESPGQAGGKGSKQPRPRRLPRIHSPERNRTGGIKRSCGRQGDTRHTSPRVLAYALTPVARPTATRGTATTSHAAPARRPGQAALTPVVGRSGATGACEVGEGWSVTGQPAQEKGMGEIREGWEEQGKANPTRLGHVFKRPPSVAPAAAESSDGERTADR